MANTILHKRSSSTGVIPTVGNLTLGELAVNTFDGKLYMKKNDGAESIVEIGGGGSAGGADTEVQYNNGTAFGGMPEFTYNDGTGELAMSKAGVGSNDSVLYVNNSSGSIFSYAVDAVAGGATSGAIAIRGTATCPAGKGVVGYASGAGTSIGIDSTTGSNADTGKAVRGTASHLTGATIGVEGLVSSALGTAGKFTNLNGTSTKVLLGLGSDLIAGETSNVEMFKIDDTGEATFAGNVVGHIAFTFSGAADYPLILTDDGKLITMTNAAANTLTVPLNATIAFPIGTQILVEQNGTGQTTITPEGAVILLSAGGLLATSSQYSMVTLIKKATDTWLVAGDLA